MSAVNIAELEKIVSKQRNAFRPEDLFELTQNLGYQPAYQDKTWQVLTKDEEFVAARVYRPVIRKMAYPVSGRFESLDEIVNNLGEIEKTIFSPFFNFYTIMFSGGAAASLTGVFVASILEKYTDMFSEHPWIMVPALACQLVLTFSGLIVGGILGHVVSDKRFSHLPQSAQEYLYGHKAVENLLSKISSKERETV